MRILKTILRLKELNPRREQSWEESAFPSVSFRYHWERCGSAHWVSGKLFGSPWATAGPQVAWNFQSR